MWTLKESYIKARGMGLSLPLDTFSFDLVDAGTVAFRCDDAVDAAAARWSFCQWRTEAGHLVSLCAERSTREPIDLVCRSITSCGGERPWHGVVEHASGGTDAWRVQPAPLPAR